jgi:predicted permease
MREVISLGIIYMLTMLLGYFLKSVGIFTEETKKAISNVIFYVTLPAMLISCFAEVEVNLWYLASLMLGIIVNIGMVLIATFLSKNKSRDLKGIYTINGAGFNMGNLAMPFLQNFYPMGMSYLCMFDMGDSIFTLGTTYSIASMRMGKQVKSPLHAIARSLVSSIPFDVSVIMTMLALVHVRLPVAFLEFVDFLGKGNGCLAMLLIGISFTFHMSKTSVKEVITLLFERYFVGIIAAIIIFCFLPAPLVMRQILATAVFAASPSVALIFTMRLGVSTEVAGAVAPISAVLMIPLMSLVMWFVGN